MNTVVDKKNNCELVISSIDNFMADPILPPKPTVCLIVVHDKYETSKLLSMTKKAIDVEAIAFLTWGNFSEKLNDLIDEIIEQSMDKDLTHITTISQQNEEVVDIAWFFINSTYFDDDDYRYLVLFDTPTANWEALQKELIECFSKFER